MQGQYSISRKVRDLEEGYEFQPNRFIADKNDKGCHVTYISQNGDVRYLMPVAAVTGTSNVWLDSNQEVDCVVDFVPDSHRALWKELQKLGKCYLEYNPANDVWNVRFPENPLLDFPEDERCKSQAAAIDDFFYNIDELRVVYNGHRYFDCRDHTNFKKISDDEARKLMGET